MKLLVFKHPITYRSLVILLGLSSSRLVSDKLLTTLTYSNSYYLVYYSSVIVI